MTAEPNAIRTRKDEIIALQQKLSALTVEKSKMISTISEYEAFSQSASEAIILNLSREIDQLSTKTKALTDKTADLNRRVAQASNELCSPFILWKYLSNDQTKTRALIDILKSEEAALQKKISENRSLVETKNRILLTEKAKNESHRGIDIEKALVGLKVCSDRIEETTADLEAAKADLAALEATLAPHLSVQKKMIDEVSKLDDDLLLANKYSSALSKASEDAKARRDIHIQCADYFGEGKPNKVIEELTSKRNRACRDLQKIERRIVEEIRKHEMDIDSVLIDGSNMCYTSGNEFIGLTALRVLVHHLGLKWHVTVVFDASIRKLLKATTQDIQKNLGPKISTYIAPDKHAADEYILKLAEGAEKSYIVTNDRYSEWHDYDAVRESRAIPFFIANNKVMVNDLNLSIDF